VFCGRNRISIGCVHDNDSARRCSGDVDIVDPYTRSSDDAKLLGRIH
jgi:hypothetical protein